jgi:hypothetical protein
MITPSKVFPASLGRVGKKENQFVLSGGQPQVASAPIWWNALAGVRFTHANLLHSGW